MNRVEENKEGVKGAGGLREKGQGGGVRVQRCGKRSDSRQNEHHGEYHSHPLHT
jgi:hypothetical protein